VPYRGDAGALIGDVRAAGLTGRGGASFPVHRKLEAVAAARPGRAIVVGNAAEGEPASHKDEALLFAAPHLVLDGLQLAAEAVGARRAVLYVRADLLERTRLDTQMPERYARRLDRVAVEIVSAPARFLAGQESALASLISGGPAVPRFTPPRVFERGVDGRPTLVQNVETLAHLALIARYGPGWFRALGTPGEPGTMLCTLRPADGSVSVAEVAIGAPLAGLLDLRGVSAVLVGGYHGAWIPAAQAATLSLSNAALRPAGAFTGAGVLAALPADRCGLVESARVARYLALESAGQCGPCRSGLPSIAAAMAELAGGQPGPRVLTDLSRWAGLVEGRGACHHPDGTVRFLRSALGVFAAEVRRHQRGRCSAASDRPFLPVPAGPSTDADWSRP
jgi:NADH:ubiquinone oxidoreductase subunit F (NADH-binding)